jgi:hypothetical protein
MDPISQAQPASSIPSAAPHMKTSGFAITSLVLGILSLFPNPVSGIPLGILALIFGILANKKIKQGLMQGKGLALTGIITGAVGLVIGLVIFVMFTLLVTSAVGDIREGIDTATQQQQSQPTGGSFETQLQVQ